jgi:hypothetical protein
MTGSESTHLVGRNVLQSMGQGAGILRLSTGDVAGALGLIVRDDSGRTLQYCCSKVRDQWLAFDRMLKDTVRSYFAILMMSSMMLSTERLGRTVLGGANALELAHSCLHASEEAT